MSEEAAPALEEKMTSEAAGRSAAPAFTAAMVLLLLSAAMFAYVRPVSTELDMTRQRITAAEQAEADTDAYRLFLQQFPLSESPREQLTVDLAAAASRAPMALVQVSFGEPTTVGAVSSATVRFSLRGTEAAAARFIQDVLDLQPSLSIVEVRLSGAGGTTSLLEFEAVLRGLNLESYR